MAAPEIELGLRIDQVVMLAVFGIVGVLGLFALLALARIWGMRIHKHGGPCGSLDLDDLRRQRDAGRISHEEYEAVRAGLMGTGTAGPKARQVPAKAGEVRPAAQSAGPGGSDAGGTSTDTPSPPGPIKDTGGPGAGPERNASNGQE